MPSTIRAILADMRAIRRECFAELAQLPDARLASVGVWSRGPADVRFLLLHLTEHEDDHRLQLAGLLAGTAFRQSGAQRNLGAAEVTRGALYGALEGLVDADLDLTPPGEWSARQILAHTLRTERSYLINCRHAVALFHAGQPFAPLRDEQLPETPTLAGVALADIVAQLDAAREETLTGLADLPDSDLAAPTIWSERAMDVNFRLLRFADHEREHTLHLLKWRAGVDRRASEAQHLLDVAWHARGLQAAQLVGLPDDLVDRDLGAGANVRGLLEHVVGSEAYLKRQIETAG